MRAKTLKSILFLSLALTLFLAVIAACSTTSTEAITDPDVSLEAILLEQGEFQDADASHRGSGTMEIFQEGDKRLVRFENFEVTSGPKLKVYLVENIDGGSCGRGNYVDLGDLQSTNGNQNYEIPADVDLSNYTGVMIYCEPFNVVFATAPFQ